MDTKLALVKMITLVFRESQIIGTERSTDIVNGTLSKIRFPKISFEQSEGRETINHLRNTLLWMMEQPENHVFGRDDLLTRLRCNINEQNNLYQALESVIKQELPEVSLKKACSEIRAELREFVKLEEARKTLADMNRSVLTGITAETKASLLENIERLSECLTGVSSSRSIHEIACVKPGDKGGFKELVRKGMDEEEGTGGIQYGLQGLNRMCGHTGKMKFGEWWHVYALPHNFKSGLLLRLMNDALMYNDPPPVRIGFKPGIIRISFENEAHRDVISTFEYLYTMENKERPDYSIIDEDYIFNYINERYSKRGWEWRMYRLNPTEFTFRDLFDFLDRIESENIEIKMLTLDYLAMISKLGCAPGPAGFEVRDLVRRVRNYCSRKGILVINAHQLSTEAKAIIRGGFDQRKFLAEIEGKGYFDGSKAIDNEPDGEIYIHIYKNKKLDEKWLMFRRGKHRKVTITPEQDLEFSYKLHPLYALPVDIFPGMGDKSYQTPGGLSRSDSPDDDY
jgi:hypothetical protein